MIVSRTLCSSRPSIGNTTDGSTDPTSRYFRQLQEISDTVAEVEWEGLAATALHQHETDKAELEAKINTARARQRYLEHLARSQEDGTMDEDQEVCILCRSEFLRGYITSWYVFFWRKVFLLVIVCTSIARMFSVR